jgi:hypothetical protein
MMTMSEYQVHNDPDGRHADNGDVFADEEDWSTPSFVVIASGVDSRGKMFYLVEDFSYQTKWGYVGSVSQAVLDAAYVRMIDVE